MFYILSLFFFFFVVKIFFLVGFCLKVNMFFLVFILDFILLFFYKWISFVLIYEIKLLFSNLIFWSFDFFVLRVNELEKVWVVEF